MKRRGEDAEKGRRKYKMINTKLAMQNNHVTVTGFFTNDFCGNG